MKRFFRTSELKCLKHSGESRVNISCSDASWDLGTKPQEVENYHLNALSNQEYSASPLNSTNNVCLSL